MRTDFLSIKCKTAANQPKNNLQNDFLGNWDCICMFASSVGVGW
jgi:hypothetical protein